MKQYKKITAIALLAMTHLFFAPTAKATDDHKPVPVELKYIGNIKNQPLVQLNFSGSKADNAFTVVIADQHGTILYENDLNGERFSQQFLLDTDDLGGAILSFLVTSKRTGQTVTYRVGNLATPIQQADIAKL